MAKKTSTNPATTTERARWGGGLLALGMLLGMATLTMFLTRPGVYAATAAERAAAYGANPAALQLEGYLGVFAYATLAIAAFFLSNRDVAAKGGFPASVFWVPVGLGAMLLVAVEAVVATALSPVAAAAAAQPLLYQTVGTVITLLAGVGVLGLGAGLLLVMWGEAQAAAPAVPKAVAYVAVLGAAATIVGGMSFVTGLRDLTPAFLGTYLLYLPLLVVGAKLAFPGLRLSPASEAETAEA